MKKIIDIFGDIGEYTFSSIFSDVKNMIKENYTDDIIIIINSTGGNCDATFSIIDVLNLLPNKKIGVVIGNCQSCANIILLNCDKRYMTNNSNFMYHGVCNNFEKGKYDNTALSNILSESNRYTKKIYKLLSKKTNIPKETLKKVKHSSDCNYLNAKECLKYNVVDEIITDISKLELKTVKTNTKEK